MAFVVGITALYATGIELVQWTLPDGCLGVSDIAANLLGSLLALGWLAAGRAVTYVPVPGRVADGT